MNPVWRARELFGLIVASGVVITGAANVILAEKGVLVPFDFLGFGVFLTAVLLLHLGLCLAGSRTDELILPAVATLSGIGLVLVFRLVGSAIATRQTTWLVLGVIVCGGVIALARDLGKLRRFKYTLAAIGVGLVALTLLFGQDVNGSGARLWLGIGSYVFQPSELLKVLLVVFLAAYLDEYASVLSFGYYRPIGPIALPPAPYLIPLGAIWGVAVLLLVAQRDLGAALLFFGIFVAMLYLASGRWLFLIGPLAAFAVAVYLAYFVIPIFQLRVDAWLDPWSRADTSGYQIIQSLIALGTGGVFGTGLGQGRPDFVPAIQTDFVLSALGEETGLAGTLALIACLMILIHRGYRVAAGAPTTFARLLAAGLTTSLAIQSIVIMGGVLRLLPLTGVTLPYVSYGGSSIVVSYLLLGLLLRVGEMRRA